MEKSLQPPGLSCGEGPWHERTTKTAVKSATGKAPKRRPTTGFVLFVPPLYYYGESGSPNFLFCIFGAISGGTNPLISYRLSY